MQLSIPSSLPAGLQDSLTHNNCRVFKPDKLREPRDFKLPKFVGQRQGHVVTINDDVGTLIDARSLINESDSTETYSTERLNKMRPLIVEIGAGKGMHACLYAKQNPDHDIIAIERTLNKFSVFSATTQALKQKEDIQDNLLPVHADAIPYSVFAFAPMSIDTFFLLYPNPEPKNANQQWLNMPFFEFLLSRLKPNGKVILASNIESYIENAYKQSCDTWQLYTTKFKIPKHSARTHFEIKYLARNETCWEIQMIKPEYYRTRFDGWYSHYLRDLSQVV